MRSFEMPGEAGLVRLETEPFPAATLRLLLDVEPRARGRLTVGGELRYLTSVGLRSTDERADGSERNTASRSHRLDVDVYAAVRLGESPGSVRLGAGLGWGVRAFDSEAPVTLPDYGLGGPRLRAFAVFPIAERLLVALGPEVEWLLVVDDSLTGQGVDAGTLAVGGEARVRLALFDAFHAEALYRESHATLSADGGDSTDRERYGALELLYRP